jgi:hypothetical protein
VSKLDSSLDLLADGTNAEYTACDALSIGIGFEALEATPGSSVAFTPPPECAGN